VLGEIFFCAAKGQRLSADLSGQRKISLSGQIGEGFLVRGDFGGHRFGPKYVTRTND
jgi:hypothetical protein